MMLTAASPCLYRKWKAFDSPLAFLWLLCLKSVQVCSPHPQSVVTNKWNKHPVVTLTVKNHLSLCGLPAYWLAWRTLEPITSVACAPPVELQQAQSVGHSAPSPAPAKPYLALQFKFRLHLRPHTPWPCVTAEGKARAAGPVCESGGAHHGERGWASWDCWYWAARRAPGTIHQNRAVCTVGIVMNNPCFLYASLCYQAYPITLSVAFSTAPKISRCCICITHFFFFVYAKLWLWNVWADILMRQQKLCVLLAERSVQPLIVLFKIVTWLLVRKNT